MKKSEKKVWLYWGALLLLLLFITSCSTPKQIVITEKRIEKVTETVHDTIFKIEKDSSYYQALLACQENGKVILQPIRSQPGKNLAAPKVNINNNQLFIDCEAKAQELFAKWKSTHTTITIEKEMPVYIEHDLTFSEKLQIWIGRIVILLLGLLLFLKLIDKRLKA